MYVYIYIYKHTFIDLYIYVYVHISTTPPNSKGIPGAGRGAPSSSGVDNKAVHAGRAPRTGFEG